MNKYDPKVTAARIKNSRGYVHGMTQFKLGRVTNVNPSMISAWEGGRRMLNVRSLIKISIAVNTSIDYLLGIEDQNSRDILSGCDYACDYNPRILAAAGSGAKIHRIPISGSSPHAQNNRDVSRVDGRMSRR